MGEQARLSGRHPLAYNPWPDLQVGERKPGALRNGAPVQPWEWPPPIARLRDGLLKKPGGDRQFVELLCAAPQDSLEAVAVACELAQDTPSAAAVLNLLHRLQPDPPPIEVAPPEGLKRALPPQADLSRYDPRLQARGGTPGAPEPLEGPQAPRQGDGLRRRPAAGNCR